MDASAVIEAMAPTRVGGRPVALGHARQRSVLVALLVEPARPVPIEALVDLINRKRSVGRAVQVV